MANFANHASTTVLVCLIVLLGINRAAGQISQTSPDKKSGEVFKNLKVMNNTPSDMLLSSMQFMTSSLGVHCEYCHVENAFEKDDKKPKQTARQMMQMVDRINKTEFHGKQQLTCYSCHHGSPKPLTIPVIAESPPRLLSEVASDVPQSPNQVADVIAKYIHARGGAEAVASLSSLQERGTFRSDTTEFPMEFYAASPARSSTVIHFPGTDRITTFDGTSGWMVVPGHPTHVMTTGEADAARMDADFQFAMDPKKIFPEIKLIATAKIGGEDAVVLSGERPGLPPVEMYFSTSSGLLLRTVQYVQATLGLNPTQTDYSDYREVHGVKVPFHWISATPTGRFSVQIESARANEAIPDKIFLMSSGQ